MRKRLANLALSVNITPIMSALALVALYLIVWTDFVPFVWLTATAVMLNAWDVVHGMFGAVVSTILSVIGG